MSDKQETTFPQKKKKKRKTRNNRWHNQLYIFCHFRCIQPNYLTNKVKSMSTRKSPFLVWTNRLDYWSLSLEKGDECAYQSECKIFFIQFCWWQRLWHCVLTFEFDWKLLGYDVDDWLGLGKLSTWHMPVTKKNLDGCKCKLLKAVASMMASSTLHVDQMGR